MIYHFQSSKPTKEQHYYINLPPELTIKELLNLWIYCFDGLTTTTFDVTEVVKEDLDENIKVETYIDNVSGSLACHFPYEELVHFFNSLSDNVFYFLKINQPPESAEIEKTSPYYLINKYSTLEEIKNILIISEIIK